MSEQDKKTCAVCTGTKLKKLFSLKHGNQTYTMDVCPSCGLVQAADKIIPAQPTKAKPRLVPSRQEHNLEKNSAYRQWLGHVRDFCRDSRGKLLDIGCGRANFMSFAKNLGFEVFGFDSNKDAVLAACQDFSQVCCAQSVEEYMKILGKTDMKFDMVTLWDVLEHMDNPTEFLSSIRPFLKPGGLLFVCVPSSRSMRIKRQLFNFARPTYDQRFLPLDHRFYFSRKALEKCVENSGFQPLDSGAVAQYRQKMTSFEIMRRCCHYALRAIGAPANIYVWARLAPPIIKPEQIPYRQKDK